MKAEKRNNARGFSLTWLVTGAVVLAGAVMAGLPSLWSPRGPDLRGQAHPDSPAADTGTAAVADGLAGDVRVRAFLEAYEAFVDSVQYTEDDAIFFVGDHPIYFQDGRMLGEARLADAESYDPIFYRYSLGPLTEPLPLSGDPVYSTDLLERIFGRTESQIRSHGRSGSFLGRKVFINSFCLDALRAVETDIRAAARKDEEVASWVDGIDVAYSFIYREITGSASRSYHAWGLAIDLVPASFHNRPVYWRWSRVLDPEWYRIPPDRRLNPPQAVVQAFERHGFVWGGKWAHFDTIHFEYRPEIIGFNRLLEESGG